MKKEIALVIPTSILMTEKKQLTPNDKLVFGLHYAYLRKKGHTFLTIVEIGKLLDLHPNIVSKSISKLESQQLIRRIKGGFEVITETIVEKQKGVKGAEEVLIPFKIYNISKKQKTTKLSGGAILLWSEYNKYRDTPKGHYVSRENTAKNIGSSVSILSKWTAELEERQLIERTIRHGRKGRELTIRTIDISTVDMESKDDTTLSSLKQNTTLPNITKESEKAPKKIVKTYREVFGDKEKKKSKKKQQKEDLLKKELEEEKSQWQQRRKEGYYDDDDILDFGLED